MKEVGEGVNQKMEELNEKSNEKFQEWSTWYHHKWGEEVEKNQ